MILFKGIRRVQTQLKTPVDLVLIRVRFLVITQYVTNYIIHNYSSTPLLQQFLPKMTEVSIHCRQLRSRERCSIYPKVKFLGCPVRTPSPGKRSVNTRSWPNSGWLV